MIEYKMRCSSAHEPATRAQVSTEELSANGHLPRKDIIKGNAKTDEITEDRRDTAASTNLSNTATLTPCNNESHSINLDLKAISEEGGGTEQQLPALGVEEDETQRVYEIIQPVATRNSTAKLTLRSDQPTSYYTFPASQCSPDLTALESRVGIVGENVGSGGGIPLEVGLLKNSSPSVTTSFSATHQPTGFNSSLPNDGMPPRALLRKVCDKRSADESDERAFAQSRLAFRQRLLNADEGTIRNAAHMISSDDRVKLRELEKFAERFKMQRISFGFTQGDVGTALGQRYGIDFSQTTVSRFESLNLSFKNMRKLYPLLRQWMTDVETAVANGAPLSDVLHSRFITQNGTPTSNRPTVSTSFEGSSFTSGVLGIGSRKRRKRTNLEANQRAALDAYFEQNPHPSNDDIRSIAATLALNREVVKVWFCNHRQKLRKIQH